MAYPSGTSFQKFGAPANLNNSSAQAFQPQNQGFNNSRPAATSGNPMQLQQPQSGQSFNSFYNKTPSSNQPNSQANPWAVQAGSNTGAVPMGLQSGPINTQAPAQQFNQRRGQSSGPRSRGGSRSRGGAVQYSNRLPPSIPQGINTMPPPAYPANMPQGLNTAPDQGQSSVQQVINSASNSAIPSQPAATAPAQIGQIPKAQHTGRRNRGPEQLIDFSDYDANHFVKMDPNTGAQKFESDLKYIGVKRLRCHSHAKELDKKEKQSFKAKKFRIGSIPENPPKEKYCSN